MRETFKKFNILLLPIILLCAVSIVLFLEGMDISYKPKRELLTELPVSVIAEKKNATKVSRTCLVLVDSRQESSDVFREHIEYVLKCMRVNFDLVDLATDPIPSFLDYRTAVIAFQNLDALGDDAMTLIEWVSNEGGRTMFLCTPDTTPVFRFFSSKLDIADGGNFFSEIEGITLAKNFMIGSDGFTYNWGERVATAQNVRLGSNAKVYAYSDDETKMPLVWSNKCGKGLLVMSNHGLVQKSSAGITAATYALLEDVCIYPVINASLFFLDDFPSPVPMGDASYIRKDFNRDIASFYSNIWWPDMLQIADDYGLKYTGVVIEDYSDDVDPPFPSYSDRERFNYFGATILKNGGEIGIHGYNHQSLVFTNFDYKGEAGYNKWKSEESMVAALNEVFRFTKEMYPDVEISTYVPPSNILSVEGREVLKNNFPQIKTIASLYLEGGVSYTQDFCVAEDGIVELPRVISGTQIDPYMRWSAINALNLFYVNSHFMHPDDVLDEDRGAALGWNTMRDNLVSYISWLYKSAPNIRNMTARNGSWAVQRYDALSYDRIDSETEIKLRLFGFWDEAELIIRTNGAKVGAVTGGSLEYISEGFYLLKATSANVNIEIAR